MPQLLVTTPVTLTDLSSYFVGWSLSSAMRTPRAAQPEISERGEDGDGESSCHDFSIVAGVAA